MIKIEKVQALNEWLEKQETHHRRLSEQSNSFKERMFADAMKQVKTMIKNKGWDETYNYIKNFYERAKNSNMVGPYALAMVYKKIKDKMWSLKKA